MTDERKKTSSWHPDFVVALYENSNSDKLYTMDQMREYADAFHRSRVAASPAAPSPAQTERGAFKAMHKHLDTSEETDAWGQPKFKHPHVESAWLGWKARAALQIGG